MAAMNKMKAEESEKTILYPVTSVRCSPILIEKTLLNFMTADITQDYTL